MSRATEYRITFVCMGNICRSPTAHGVMRHKVRGAGLLLGILLSGVGLEGWAAWNASTS